MAIHLKREVLMQYDPGNLSLAGESKAFRKDRPVTWAYLNFGIRFLYFTASKFFCEDVKKQIPSKKICHSKLSSRRKGVGRLLLSFLLNDKSGLVIDK
jgi:hypothetical protein